MNERKLSEHKTDELWTGNFPSVQAQQMIYYKSLRPKNHKHLKILILHDFYDYHQRYLEMGYRLKDLLAFPVEICWMDFKGFGLSAGTRGHVDQIDDLFEDTRKLLEQMKQADPQVPLMLCGQGLGAMVALKLIDLTSSVKPLVDFCAVINPMMSFGSPFLDFDDSLLGRLIPSLSKVGLPVKLNFQKICNDEDKVHDLKSDPLIRSRLSLGTLSQMAKAAELLRKRSYYINRPTSFFCSDDDIFIDQEQLKSFVKGIPDHHATYRLYHDAKHDLANDKNREMMFNDMCKWIFLQMEGRL